MQLAVTAWKFGTEGLLADELARQGEVAEQMGFDSFWLPENHFSGPAAIPSPLMLLAVVAARTTRLKLGSTSYLLPIRNPLLAAEEVAVLDRLSGGRVILGIGRGFQDAMFETFGVPVKEKRARFKANLAQMISAWQGEPVCHHDGEPVTLSPLPVQQPHPPLWVAAFGPLAIKQAASLGLPYIASPMESMDGLAQNYALHRQHLEEAGLAQVEVTPVMRTLFITSSKPLAQEVKDALAAEAHNRRVQAPLDDWALVGEASQVKEKVAEYQEKTGMNYLIARGRIPGLDSEAQIRSHRSLIECLS